MKRKHWLLVIENSFNHKVYFQVLCHGKIETGKLCQQIVLRYQMGITNLFLDYTEYA